MQVQVQRLSPVQMEIQVEVPTVEVKAEFDKAYLKLAKSARVRGFRPGKVPRDVLKRLFEPQVLQEVTLALVNTTLPKALEEHQLLAVTTPQVTAGSVSNNGPFSYKAVCEVHPEVGDVVFEGFELTRPSLVADETMVQQQLEGLRLHKSTTRVPDPPRPIAKGDLVTVDFNFAVDGIAEPGVASGVQFEIGSRKVVPEIEDALEGKNIGDVFDVDVVFPETHEEPELRGKKAEFHVNVISFEERLLPELDDAFAATVGSFETLIELRARIHTDLENTLQQRAETALARQIMSKLSDANPLDVPPALVEQQCEIMTKDIQARTQQQMGHPVPKEVGEALHQKIHPDAEKKVRAGLLMSAIAKKYEMHVTSSDLERAFQELAEQSRKNIAKLRAEYGDPEKRKMLVSMILEDKIFRFIKSKSKITDAPAASEAPSEEVSP